MPVAATEKVNLSPAFAVTSVGCVVIANGAHTVTVMVADFLLPSVEVAVMVAVPGATPVIVPLVSTVATPVLDDDHDRALLVASEGSTITVG